jgi:predicted lipoprotein with Yx(FWY)xxD motif
MSIRDPQGASRCTDECTRLWRPFLLVGAGQPTPPFGATARPDGTRQWSHAGRPLYLWSGDSSAGDVTGDGVDGTWYAVRVATTL